MTRETASKILLGSAVFNWLVALGLFLVPDTFLGLLAINPLPGQSLWVQLFAGLVFVFGIAYYWASRDFETNVPVVKLGAIGKVTVVLVAILNVAKGDISWQIMIPASADLLFGVLFIIALLCARNWPLRAAI